MDSIPETLRLCAKILEEKLPWQWRDTAEKDWGNSGPSLREALFYGYEIRIKPVPKMVPLGTEDIPPVLGCVEFCALGAGGGRSPHTRAALQELLAAMEKDNQENPIPE